MKAPAEKLFPTYNSRFIALSAYEGFIMIEDAIFGKSTEVAKILRESKWQAIFDKLYK